MQGIDHVREQDLKAHHEAEEAEEAWQNRVAEEAAYVQQEQPDLSAEEAWTEAEERVRQQDQDAEEMMAANKADELAERRMR